MRNITKKEILLSQKRFEELEMVLSDESVAERLYEEFGLK